MLLAPLCSSGFSRASCGSEGLLWPGPGQRRGAGRGQQQVQQVLRISPLWHGPLPAWHEERSLRRAERCDWLRSPFWNVPEKASQSGKDLACCVSFSSVEDFLCTVLARRCLYLHGGYLGDNLMFLMFCLHRVSGQDTAHHVPGVFGQRREALHHVHSWARRKQVDCEEVMVGNRWWQGEVLTFFFQQIC